MAFGAITTFYFPTAANAGASQWGSDVRKLLSSADAGNDATSTMSHPTGGATTRTLDPFTAATADLTQADYGFAVTPSDMNSVTGAKRFISAGDHVLTGRMKTSNVLGSTNTVTLFAYRVGPAAARTRTLLGSASASVSLPAGGGYTTATVTLALGEIVFDNDETIQYSVEDNGNGAAISAAVTTFDTGTQGGVAIRIDFPGLKILAEGAGTVTADASVAGVTGKVLGADGSVTGTATIAGVTGWVASGVGAVTGTATISGLMSSVSAFAGTVTADVVVDGDPSIVLGTEFEIDTGGSGGSSTGYAKSRVVNA